MVRFWRGISANACWIAGASLIRIFLLQKFSSQFDSENTQTQPKPPTPSLHHRLCDSFRGWSMSPVDSPSRWPPRPGRFAPRHFNRVQKQRSSARPSPPRRPVAGCRGRSRWQLCSASGCRPPTSARPGEMGGAGEAEVGWEYGKMSWSFETFMWHQRSFECIIGPNWGTFQNHIALEGKLLISITLSRTKSQSWWNHSHVS